MLLALDVGNTNIKIGIFEHKKVIQYARLTTEIGKTSDEYGLLVSSVIKYASIDREDIEGIIIASVVPSINYTLEHMCQTFFDIKPLLVGPGLRSGMNIMYDNPREVGADRIVSAIAAYDKMGGPCIVIDFGTATTFGAISEKGDFLGGAIMPGLKVSMEALVNNAAKLPRIELIKPKRAIGKSTEENMQSGVILGYVGAVDRIIQEMKAELGEHAKVIATGGMSNLIGPISDTIEHVDGRLALHGLRIIYERNKARGREKK